MYPLSSPVAVDLPLISPQIINLPNLRIVDFGVGHCGSAHDSTAWKGTYFYQQHEALLKEGEFVFADSAYPVRIILYTSTLNWSDNSTVDNVAYSALQATRFGQ